jgi:hypothetical protein
LNFPFRRGIISRSIKLKNFFRNTVIRQFKNAWAHFSGMGLLRNPIPEKPGLPELRCRYGRACGAAASQSSSPLRGHRDCSAIPMAFALLKPSLIAILSACLLFFSCTDISDGVFWSIENETSIPDNSLPNTLYIGGIITLPRDTAFTAPAGDPASVINPSGPGAVPNARYYVAAGSVFYRDADRDASANPDRSWRKISTPGSGYMVTDIAYLASNKEIIVAMTNGSGSLLYKLDPTFAPYIPDPLNPNPVPPPQYVEENTRYTRYAASIPYTGSQITRLLVVNGILFITAGTSRDPGYAFYYYDPADIMNPIKSTGLTGYDILNGAWDGTHYWFVSPAHIFKAPDPPLGWSAPSSQDTFIDISGGSTSNPGNLPEHPYFRDILFDDGAPPILSGLDPAEYGALTAPNLYIASADGIYMSTTTDATTWFRLAEGYYTSLAKIGTENPPSVYHLVCGREYGGLLEIFQAVSPGNKHGLSNPPGDYTSLPGLYNASITRLMADQYILIAGTTNRGAWNGDYPSSRWSQE